jgi:hypothetical protein
MISARRAAEHYQRRLSPRLQPEDPFSRTLGHEYGAPSAMWRKQLVVMPPNQRMTPLNPLSTHR